ncbi:MAG: hypothetical protein DMF49_02250 [Acidobacteria bacterium]|nr:MAG: hypothetical protein DMF49_02250 [Acidobacteriota bacterium]
MFFVGEISIRARMGVRVETKPVPPEDRNLAAPAVVVPAPLIGAKPTEMKEAFRHERIFP